VKKIRVRLGRKSYDVLVSTGLLHHAGQEIRRRLPSTNSQAIVVTSKNVRRHWGDVLESSLIQARVPFQVLEMDDGEPAKRLHTVEQLAERMVDAKADRQSLLVAFGGGVVGDCAGFLASIFMRGIPVVQVPTTVLAQVDASIGGKTGVNLHAGKNLIGAFHQPKAVLIDPAVLATLDDREFRAGLYESLKCGVIRDRRLFEFMAGQPEKLQQRDRNAVERVIIDSVRVKAAVVSADERESGRRRILNFGHTIGHALEAATGYTQLLHGEAIAWGMIAAATIAQETSTCTEKIAQQVRSAVMAYGPLPPVTARTEDVVARLASDKKTVAGAIHFVLPWTIGKTKIVNDVPMSVVREAIEKINNKT
jgi:3-dehydroquinate synthase